MLFPLTRTFRVLAQSLGTTPRSNAGRDNRRDDNALPLFETLEDRTLMSTYYVNTGGNDSNSGTSSSAPWRTISKVNSASLKAGDQVLFQGGQTFSGGLRPKNGGNSSSAITFSSYGNGKATIKSGGSDGFCALSKSGLWINNLDFVGSPSGKNHDGVRFETNSGRQYNVRVTNSSISGYGFAGILVLGDRNGIGFTNVQITGNEISNNVTSGIQFSAVSRNVHQSVYIARNNVHDTYGDGSSINTGNGIMLGGLAGGTIEWNTSYHNGARGGNGGVGIWAYESTNVLMQYNVSHDNKTTRGMDGDGFDFDADTQNSTMQYNYSYNNDGAGFMLDQWRANANFTNNIIRYNISQNDGRNNNYGGICVFGQIENSTIYNNTVYLSGGPGGAVGVRIKRSALGGGGPVNLKIGNNIIETSGKQLLNITSNATAGVKFVGNTWYNAGGTPSYSYAGKSYSSLSSWHSGTGQDSNGLQTNPMLNAPGAGQALSNASSLSSLTAYKLKSNSPLINRGINIASVLGASISHDFFGDSLPQGGAYEFGVNEVGIIGKPPLPAGDPAPAPAPSPTPTPTPSSSLPSDWSSANIGSVGQAGSSSYTTNGFKYTISGGGADIYGANDSFRYSYTSLSGDGSIIARVDSMTAANDWAKAGVMIRNGNAANAAEVSMMLNVNKTAQFERRWWAGDTTHTTSTSANSDAWVKLVRTGDTFNGYISSDGNNWTLVEHTTVKMNSNVEIGLGVTAHDNTKLETAVFSNVKVVH